MSDWFLYIVRCNDNSLYTGITTDVERRLSEHQASASNDSSVKANKGAKYLKGKAPLKLEYQSRCESRSHASQLEYKVKKLTKLKKERLIESNQSLFDYFSSENNT